MLYRAAGTLLCVSFAILASDATAQPAPNRAASEQATLIGPKRTVVIDKFSSLGNFTGAYGGDWDVGGGLAAMLTTALGQSGRFVVVERANPDRIAFEQKMKADNAVNPETGPQLGKVTGAQFVVIGSVTEFGIQDKGGGLSVGFSGFGRLPLGGALGTRQAEGAIGMDLRVVDASTTQVIQTVKVRETISSTSVTLGADYKGMSFGGDSFKNTPLGEAARNAIEKAVAEIVAVAARQPWQALVVDFDGKELAINAGSGAGVKAGDRFSVERIVSRLTDPTTGELLSLRRRSLGTVSVTSVEDKLSFGAFTAAGADPPARGDLVLMAR